MRTRVLLLSLVATFALIAVSVSVSAHDPHEHNEQDRQLFLISKAGAASANASGPRPEADASFALSVNASESTSPSRVYSSNQQPLPGCLGVCAQPGKAIKFGASHTGVDFEVERQDVYQGILHFSWAYKSTAPVQMGVSHVGYVTAYLSVAGTSYGQVHHSMSGNGGEVSLKLSFAKPQQCHTEERGKGCGGNQSKANDHETAPALYAHDFQLTVVVQPVSDPIRAPLGGHLQVKFDTGGGSWIRVREVPPPPPAPTVEPPVEVIEAEAYYADQDGDGEVDPEEVHFVPGVSPALLLAGLGLLGMAWRRRRA